MRASGERSARAPGRGRRPRARRRTTGGRRAPSGCATSECAVHRHDRGPDRRSAASAGTGVTDRRRLHREAAGAASRPIRRMTRMSSPSPVSGQEVTVGRQRVPRNAELPWAGQPWTTLRALDLHRDLAAGGDRAGGGAARPGDVAAVGDRELAAVAGAVDGAGGDAGQRGSPAWVQVARKPSNVPLVGWVTTTFWSRRITPPPTGTSAVATRAVSAGAAGRVPPPPAVVDGRRRPAAVASAEPPPPQAASSGRLRPPTAAPARSAASGQVGVGHGELLEVGWIGVVPTRR